MGVFVEFYFDCGITCKMSFPSSDRLLDVDKIKELAALIIKCDVDGSHDLINPLFELVSLHMPCLTLHLSCLVNDCVN